VEATLIDVRDEASASVVRTTVREAGTAVGLPLRDLELLVAAASELAFNQVHHARFGGITIAEVRSGDARGIEVVATDRGRGLPDAPAALAGRLTGKGLGIGLAAVRRAAHELDVDVRHGEGTLLAIRCFATPPATRPELAIEGRPYPGEPRSGDDGVFLRTDTGFLAAVADGLGHGPAARVASARAIDVVRLHAGDPLPVILQRAHEALHGTRGCAMTLARHDTRTGTLSVCGVGNIDTMVLTASGERRGHVPKAGTLGVRSPPRDPRITDLELHSGNALIMASDGLPRRTEVARIPGLTFHASPWIAHHLVTEHARSNDDVLVLVAK